MTPGLEAADAPPLRDGGSAHSQTTEHPGQPPASGYAETPRSEATAVNQPDPDAAGNQAAQVAATLPGEDEEQNPAETDPTPPGENKREPIKDPNPADTKLHVQQGSR